MGARAAYRALVRELGRSLGVRVGARSAADGAPAELLARVRRAFEAPPPAAAATPAAAAAAGLALARDAAQYVGAVRNHKDLLQTYNISIERDRAHQQQLVKSTAARVGLSVPDVEAE